MKINIVILILFLKTIWISAQVKGIVVDENDKPIPYVNIWVENENIGTTSEEDGTFSLDIKDSKALVFSALGYETKKVLSTVKVIILKQIAYELRELVVSSPKNSQKIKINSYKKSKINVYSTAGNNPTIIAKKIVFSDQVKFHPFIKEIKFLSHSQIDKAKLILRFFDVNSSGNPGGDFLDNQIILEINKGKKENKVNLEKYKIRIPEDGLFIAFEWMIIDENKYSYKYTTEEKNKKEYKYDKSYDPKIGLISSDNQTSWYYRKGAWFEGKRFDNSIKLSNYQNNFGELAIELTLTN